MIISGCSSSNKEQIWHYKGETSLNSPIPISAYVEVTQQKIDGYNNELVTCERNICPIFNKKTIDKNYEKSNRVAVFKQ